MLIQVEIRTAHCYRSDCTIHDVFISYLLRFYMIFPIYFHACDLSGQGCTSSAPLLLVPLSSQSIDDVCFYDDHVYVR